MHEKYSCCISNCDTHGISKLFFNIPINFNTCPKWLTVISCSEQVVNENALVCVRHFDKSDLLVKPEGEIVAVDCQAMSDLFVPSTSYSMEAGPSKTKNTSYFPDYMFYILDRDAVPVNVNSKYLDSEDFLRDFFSLNRGCCKRLAGCNTGWTLNVCQNFLIFFYLYENKVKSTIKIYKDLHVEITLSGRLMDPLDVTRWLPPSSRITRWSQLKMILLHFGMNTQKNILPNRGQTTLTPV